jgi:two-component system sensor histidine kinase AtoS
MARLRLLSSNKSSIPHLSTDSFRLRRKFFLAFTSLVLGLTASLLLVVENRQNALIVREMEKRGMTIATHLAAVSTNDLLTYNFVALEQAVEHVQQSEEDVRYVIVLDRDGRVAAYSRHDDKVGTFLPGEVHQRAAHTMVPLIQQIREQPNQAAHYDIAVPVLIRERQEQSEKWGTVRVGLSMTAMSAEIAQTRWRVLLLGVIGVLSSTGVAAFLARRIAAPLATLVEGTIAVARGELSHTIPIQTRDEIAVLATNFNHMTRELLKHRTALEQSNCQLDQRVRELSLLTNYNENILKSMTSGLLTLDIDGHIATFNATAEAITGLRSAAVRGQSYQQVFAHQAQCLQILETSRHHHTPLTAPRLDFHRQDGQYVPLALRTAMLEDNAGQVVGLLVIFEDLSSIQTLERQLRRADRLAALGHMAAGVAHEIKNPLAAIRTFVQLVHRKHHESRFLEKFDRVVPHELNRINFIVEDMLELARPARLHCVLVSLPALLQRVLDVYAERMQQQHIILKTDFAAALPPLMADTELLYRSFTNIVLNALEAMPAQGELTIGCRPVPKPLVDFAMPARQDVPAVSPNVVSLADDLYATDVEIRFQDTGVGIPADQLDAVFTPFWTTKPKGTGLGLALTHKIIEEHRGSIHVASEVGHGTVITVRLPAIGDASPPA